MVLPSMEGVEVEGYWDLFKSRASASSAIPALNIRVRQVEVKVKNVNGARQAQAETTNAASVQQQGA